MSVIVEAYVPEGTSRDDKLVIYDAMEKELAEAGIAWRALAVMSCDRQEFFIDVSGPDQAEVCEMIRRLKKIYPNYRYTIDLGRWILAPAKSGK